jgi:hypothetical protein
MPNWSAVQNTLRGQQERLADAHDEFFRVGRRTELMYQVTSVGFFFAGLVVGLLIAG